LLRSNFSFAMTAHPLYVFVVAFLVVIPAGILLLPCF
jgi:hypothetical protein